MISWKQDLEEFSTSLLLFIYLFMAFHNVMQNCLPASLLQFSVSTRAEEVFPRCVLRVFIRFWQTEYPLLWLKPQFGGAHRSPWKAIGREIQQRKDCGVYNFSPRYLCVCVLGGGSHMMGGGNWTWRQSPGLHPGCTLALALCFGAVQATLRRAHSSHPKRRENGPFVANELPIWSAATARSPNIRLYHHDCLFVN